MRRMESEQGRFTLVFLAAPKDQSSALDNRAPELELTYNWDGDEQPRAEGRLGAISATTSIRFMISVRI